MLYFSYHYISGNRGLLAYSRLKSEDALLERQLTELQSNNKNLQQKVILLHKDNVDQDMLDEQARAVLGYVEKDEQVIPLPLKIIDAAPQKGK